MQTEYERSVAAHQAKMAAGWTAPLTTAEIEGVRSGRLTLGVTGATRFLATIDTLREELKVTDQLLEKREQVLRAIPECPTHGPGCVPWALEWIAAKIEGREPQDSAAWSRHIGLKSF